MAACCNPTGLLAKNSVLRCDSVSDDRDTGEGSLAIVVISEEGVYIVMTVVVATVVVAAVVMAAVVVAAVVVDAVVVAAARVESRFVAAVVVVKESSKSMVSLSTAAMALIAVNGLTVVDYG